MTVSCLPNQSFIAIMLAGYSPKPFFYIFLQGFVFVVAILTRPFSSLRYPAVVLISILCWAFLSTIHYHMENRTWKAIWCSVATSFPLVSVEKLLLSRWSYDARGPEAYRKKNDAVKRGEEKPRPNSTLEHILDRLIFALDTLFSTRGLGKPWEVKGIPPGHVSSRRAFLLRTAMSTFFFLFIVTLAGSQPLPDPDLVSLRRIPLLTRLANVTSEELLVRSLVTIGFGFSAFCLLSASHGLFDLLFVGTGLSSPAISRPGFGSFRELYTIRRLWG